MASSANLKFARPGRDQNLVIELLLPGRHNALNALAAIAVACEEGVQDAAIQSRSGSI